MLNDRDNILSALSEKALKVREIMIRANVANEEACQSLLLKMRDEGVVKFDIHSGRWILGWGGEDFRLILTTYPPGVGLPSHHHPSVAHNYVLEGVAESQYEGEELKRFTAGQSYQDKALVPHTISRNADRSSPLKYLIAYTVKKGRPFLLVPWAS
jgi:quercetin dioxygenase-like cupin family protein